MIAIKITNDKKEFEKEREKMKKIKATISADEFAVKLSKVVTEMVDEKTARHIILDEYFELGARLCCEFFGDPDEEADNEESNN